MKRIAIFQSDLHVGGIQRSLVNLLRNLGKEDIEVDVFLFDDSNIFFDIDFAENIHLYFIEKLPYWNRFIYFDIARKLWSTKIMSKLDQKRNYDAAIDFNSYWNECAIGALAVPAKKRICWIHNDVAVKSKNEYKYRIIHHFFKGKYKYYEEFVPVSHGIQPAFESLNSIKDCGQFHVIPNHIDTAEIHQKLSESLSDNLQKELDTNKDKVKIISVGRLCHQKGYDLMLPEIKMVMQKRSDIHFYIAGDGPDREQLVNQARQLGIEEYVTFLGNLSNPFPVMKRMDAFFMTSRYEGQPLAFWEAKAVGLPVIIPKHLEKYTEGIPGCEDVVDSLCRAERCNPQFDALEEYNQRIRDGFEKLIK